MGVQVVHDQDDGVGVGIVLDQQSFNLAGPVDLGAAWSGVDVTPTAQGLDPDEDRAGAFADVFVVLLQMRTKFRFFKTGRWWSGPGRAHRRARRPPSPAVATTSAPARLAGSSRPTRSTGPRPHR